MSRCIFLIYAGLLSSIALFCHADETNGSFTSPTTYSPSSILCPDRDYELGTFGVADFQVSESGNSYQVILRLENYENQSSKQCSFNVSTSKPISKVGGTSLARSFNTNRFMLTWFDETTDDESNVSHRPQLIGMNLDDCQSYDLHLPDLKSDPIAISMGTVGGFELYIEDTEHCKYLSRARAAYGERCIRVFNRNFQDLGHPDSLVNDLDWSTVKVSYIENSKMFHGMDALGTYRVRERGNGKVKELLSIPNAHPQIKVVTEGRVVCWLNNPIVDTSVNCSEYKNQYHGNEWGDVIHTKIITYQHAVTPLAIRPAGNYEIMLLVGDSSCASDQSCWNLKESRVNFNGSASIPTIERKLDCTGDWKDLVIDFSNLDDYYWYVCRQGDRYLYGTNFL